MVFCSCKLLWCSYFVVLSDKQLDKGQDGQPKPQTFDTIENGYTNQEAKLCLEFVSWSSHSEFLSFWRVSESMLGFQQIGACEEIKYLLTEQETKIQKKRTFIRGIVLKMFRDYFPLESSLLFSDCLVHFASKSPLQKCPSFCYGNMIESSGPSLARFALFILHACFF